VRSRLWREPDFVKLWAGQSVSLFGTLIGRFAFQLVAAITLEASPLQMSVLRVFDMAPALLIGLVAGVWVDRLRRRPLLIWADLGRTLLLLSVPAAALLGALRIELLYLVGFSVGVMATVFDVAYRSYLPSIVRRDQLVEANARLQATNSVAEVAGFGLAGGLVQVLTAPIAVLVDALSFLVSAVSLALIRRPESPPSPSAERLGTWPEIRDGLGVVWREPVLRALAGAKASRDFFVHIWVAVLILFLTRDLDIAPVVMGLLFAIGGVSAFLGAVFVVPITRRLGVGPTLIAGFFLQVLSLVAVPLAGGPYWLVLFLVGVGQLFDACYILYEVNETSLIQAVSPTRALGRVNASLYFVSWAAMLAGSLVGGLLGEAIGLRWAMMLGVGGGVLSVVWLLLSPVPRLRHIPPAPDQPAHPLPAMP
jgi:MFS family permease